MRSLLEKIAAEVGVDIPGVDWEALEARFGMSREELVYHTDTSLPPDQTGAFAYDLFIQAARARAEAQLNLIALSFQVQDDPATRENEIVEAMTAWDAVQHAEIEIGDVVLRELRRGKAFLPADAEFRVDREVFRAMVSSTYLICLYGALIHLKKLMQFQETSPADIVRSADDVTRMFNALAIMGEKGVLNSLRPGAVAVPVNGFGSIVVTAPVVIVVAISLVFAVGIVAYLIVTTQRQAVVNEVAKKKCQEAMETGSPEDKELCLELLKLNHVATQGPLETTALSLGQAAFMIAGAYLFVRFTPVLVRKLWNLR